MEKVTTVTGVAIPLKMSNVDTDQILPGQFLKRVTKSGYEDALFYEWRTDPDFVLNQPVYQNGKILVAGPDFAIGSSREHAVWALRDWGIAAVISPRFGDIFRTNAGKQGLVTAVVSEEEVERLWRLLDAHPGLELTVDLVNTRIHTPETAPESARCELSFTIEDYTRWRLMEGLDDISLTLRHEDEIAAYESRRPAWMPTTISEV